MRFDERFRNLDSNQKSGVVCASTGQLFCRLRLLFSMPYTALIEFSEIDDGPKLLPFEIQL